MSEPQEAGAAARAGARRPEPIGPRGTGAAAGAAAAKGGATGGSPAHEPAGSLAELRARALAEQATVDAEISEIQMLVQQARTEASRQEGKRAAASDKLAAMTRVSGNPADTAELNGQVIVLTRRAGVMQSQVDVLEGKLKTLSRFRDSLARLAADLDVVSGGFPEGATADGRAASGRSRGARGGAAGDAAEGEQSAVMPPAVSRLVLSAQEDLRRDIARTMHDGPAQSLTNIVLQAQIVERLLARDPGSAQTEVRELISMVQQTLDATKSFIFDVRPMVLDDLGLVPTIRRDARERSRKAQIPVDFESFGPDRRLPMELESGLFRILDETLAAYLAGRPDRVTIRLDWSDGLEARIAGQRALPATAAGGPPAAAAAAPAPTGRGRGRGRAGPAEPEAMPAALQAMIDDRRAAESAARRAVGGLPASTRREVQQRAATLGIAVEFLEDGREVRLVIEPPTFD